MRRAIIVTALAVVLTPVSAASGSLRMTSLSPLVMPRRAALMDRRWESQETGLTIRHTQARCEIESHFTLCYGRQCAAWFSTIPGMFWVRYTDHVLWVGKRIVVRPMGAATFGASC